MISVLAVEVSKINFAAKGQALKSVSINIKITVN